MEFPDIEAIRCYLHQLQEELVRALRGMDPKIRFREDRWERAGGGGGSTQVLEKGEVWEKAGVNFSEVFGTALPPSATANRPQLAGKPFRALGVSVVIHPLNPYVPTTHLNVRFFTTEEEAPAWWFGGGFDLTPYYPFVEDAVSWHAAARDACAPFGTNLYPRFKEACDEYFFLRHRNETRGIGGLFFDDFNECGFDTGFAFWKSVGDTFWPAYSAIAERRASTPFGEREQAWQRTRRGRYVEFNLLYDRGTLFGLQSGGRTESILMSLPPRVRWDYDVRPEPHSPEAELLEHFLHPRDWLAERSEPCD